MFELVKAEKAHYPIAVLCSVLSVSRSGFYAWERRPKPARAKADAALVLDIRAAHKLGRGTYGSPRVHAELQAKGMSVGENRVARLMREDGLRARQKRRFRRTTDSNHTDPIAPNILQRNFEPEAPNTTASAPRSECPSVRVMAGRAPREPGRDEPGYSKPDSDEAVREMALRARGRSAWLPQSLGPEGGKADYARRL